MSRPQIRNAFPDEARSPRGTLSRILYVPQEILPNGGAPRTPVGLPPPLPRETSTRELDRYAPGRNERPPRIEATRRGQPLPSARRTQARDVDVLLDEIFRRGAQGEALTVEELHRLTKDQIIALARERGYQRVVQRAPKGDHIEAFIREQNPPVAMVVPQEFLPGPTQARPTPLFPTSSNRLLPQGSAMVPSTTGPSRNPSELDFTRDRYIKPDEVRLLSDSSLRSLTEQRGYTRYPSAEREVREREFLRDQAKDRLIVRSSEDGTPYLSLQERNGLPLEDLRSVIENQAYEGVRNAESREDLIRVIGAEQVRRAQTVNLTEADLSKFSPSEIATIARSRQYPPNGGSSPEIFLKAQQANKRTLEELRKSRIPAEEIGLFSKDRLRSYLRLVGEPDITFETIAETENPVMRQELIDSAVRRYNDITAKADTIEELRQLLSKPLYDVYLKRLAFRDSQSREDLFDDIIHGNVRKGRYPIETLMSNDTELLSKTLGKLGYTGFNGNFEDAIQLTWWAFLFFEGYPGIFKNSITVSSSVGQARPEDLRRILPTYPTGRATDKASLVFAALNRQSVDVKDVPPEKMERYRQLQQLDPAVVMKLAKYLYGYFGVSPSFYTPYRHIAIRDQVSPMEPFIVFYNGNAEEMAPQAGMIVPAVEDKEKYYFENLSYYAPVIARPGGIPPPPEASGLTRQIAERFTDFELQEAYGPIGMVNNQYQWRDRPELIDKILTEARRGSHWHFRSNNCANDDRPDFLEFEPRVKDDPENPILSYGTISNYRCYTVRELTESFREDEEEGFRFGVPDFLRGDPLSEFSVESVKQLRELIQAQRNPEVYNPLIEKITLGLQSQGEARRRVLVLAREYQDMDERLKEITREYVAWIFLFGIWMRHWKGPGNPYPHQARVNDYEGRTATEDYCETITRDSNVTQMFPVMDDILRRAEQISRLFKAWLLDFTRVENVFGDRGRGPVRLGREKLSQIITWSRNGDFCMMAGSDIFIQAGYFLARNLLGLDDRGFNALLRASLGVERQPDFSPSSWSRTGHPDVRHVLVEEQEQ